MNLTENEIIIIIKEIMLSLKEEELLGQNTEENYNFPIGISKKLDAMPLESYYKLINNCVNFSKLMLNKYSYELNSLNVLHEEIHNNLHVILKDL